MRNTIRLTCAAFALLALRLAMIGCETASQGRKTYTRSQAQQPMTLPVAWLV